MADSDFKIEVPISFSGGTGSKGGTDKLNDSIKKLDKTVYGTLDIMEMLSSILGDVFKVLSPIFKLLSILLLIIFMPLMPIIKLIAQGLAWLAKMLEGGGEGIWDKILSWLWVALIAVGAILLIVFAGWAVWIVALIAVALLAAWKYIVIAFEWIAQKAVEFGQWLWDGLVWIWEKLKEGWQYIVDGLAWVWNELLLPAWNWLKDKFYSIWTDYIEPAWNWLKSVGEWIWTQILKPAWEWFSDIGTKIWNILKGAFTSAVDYIKSAIRNIFRGSSGGSTKKVNDMIIQPNGQMIQTSPRDYLIATKDPSKLGGSGGITINFNNPVVREQADLKKIAEETSKILERKLWKSY